ncbi:2-dehydro-3-deoxyglucarate aldolase [Hydrogenophaga crassostreae]|uniref:2-dehydro-3-deoxyglucarate aldolase n=1 Tax=Hydrogenophaga crassostreae TaxID=1763535 RepID=A0A162SPR3_9BURK|nr:HpcH/HpaI aldolase/citrate lyase family protein [Hydrogenophaga crassostreae]AOW15207.1 2-dehydro-3-deoxyglucarate aldolase [Hydrogenophaga crassostreae]OAD39294.1 2-dehydro-3-deoxyglucarate aldolase [Hydrogenophaga crassostreae]
MDLPVNRFKRAILANKKQMGLWSHLCSHISTEILAHCGFDWLVLDMEHSPNELPDILSQLQAMTGSSATPVVRVPWNDPVTFKRLLDIGVQSFLVPYVQTAEEAQNAVAATRYPPLGMRGYAGAPRASGYGRIKDYAHRCAEEMCVLVQIETVEGLKNLEAIAAVEGVSGIFIGPGDLSAALGHLGNPKHPDVLKTIDEAIARIRACGKAPGILTGDETLARHYVAQGCLFVAVGADQNLLRDSAQALSSRFKD